MNLLARNHLNPVRFTADLALILIHIASWSDQRRIRVLRDFNWLYRGLFFFLFLLFDHRLGMPVGGWHRSILKDIDLDGKSGTEKGTMCTLSQTEDVSEDTRV